MDKIIYSTDFNKYRLFENKSTSLYERRCIDGNIVGCSRCVGYCQYSGHPGFLTEDLRKKHNCINKKCFYYIEKQKVQDGNSETKINTSDFLMSIAKDIIKPYEGMRILRAQQNNDDWALKYITISNEYPIEFIEKKICDTSGFKICLERLEYGFDVCAELLLKVI